jgi:hypothetical protein
MQILRASMELLIIPVVHFEMWKFHINHTEISHEPHINITKNIGFKNVLYIEPMLTMTWW